MLVFTGRKAFIKCIEQKAMTYGSSLNFSFSFSRPLTILSCSSRMGVTVRKNKECGACQPQASFPRDQPPPRTTVLYSWSPCTVFFFLSPGSIYCTQNPWSKSAFKSLLLAFQLNLASSHFLHPRVRLLQLSVYLGVLLPTMTQRFSERQQNGEDSGSQV